MAISFSGGRSRIIRREPPTMGKQLENFITCCCEKLALSTINQTKLYNGFSTIFKLER
jgi:hypothetical protein